MECIIGILHYIEVHFVLLHLVSCFHLWQILQVLMPIAPSGAQAIYDPSPSHSVLGCSGHSSPVGPLLVQLCFSVSPPTAAMLTSLPLPMQVPGQGLACGDGCWLSNVCPIQPHFLHSICLATGSCPAHSLRSSFRIFPAGTTWPK